MDSSWLKSQVSIFANWFDKVKSSYSTPTTTAVLIANDEELKRLAFQRQEILVKLFTSLLGLALTLGISFYGIRWVLNSLDPTKKDKEDAQKRAQYLMKSIGVPDVKLTEYELCIASNLVDPLSLDTEWTDIGGLQATIQEIKETIINPFIHHKLFASTKLIQAPKGVLFYGPPGCGKTMIAKATAKAAGARFINLQISSLVDKWYGESQKRAEAVFSLAKKLQPTIIFIDEIDSFLRMRSSSDHEATSMMKTQFMSFWDGLATDDKNMIVVIGATNRPADVDAAILRRMPTMFKIELPDVKQRKQILEVILKTESLDADVNLAELAEETDGWSGSDLHEMCRNSAIYRVRELLKISEDSNTTIPSSLGNLKKCDFDLAILKMKQYKRISSMATLQQMAYE